MDSRITQLSKRVVVEKFEKQENIPEKPLQEEKKAEQNHASDDHADHKSGEYENQRIGNFQSQDVAIDKMFYYGKK